MVKHQSDTLPFSVFRSHLQLLAHHRILVREASTYHGKQASNTESTREHEQNGPIPARPPLRSPQPHEQPGKGPPGTLRLAPPPGIIGRTPAAGLAASQSDPEVDRASAGGGSPAVFRQLKPDHPPRSPKCGHLIPHFSWTSFLEGASFHIANPQFWHQDVCWEGSDPKGPAHDIT